MPPTSVEDLRGQPFFRKTLRKRNAFLLMALALDFLVLSVVVCFHVELEPSPDSINFLGYHLRFAIRSWVSWFWLAVLFIGQAWLAWRGIREALTAEGMIPIYPDDQSQGRTVGVFNSRQLVQMVHEMADQLGIGQVQRVIVSDRPDPNAYTAHVPGWGNVVVLHANLLEILTPKRVRAIVAHEVAHMKSSDSLLYLLTGIPRAFLYLVGLVILWKIGLGLFWFDNLGILVQRIVFLGAIGWGALWVLERLHRLTNVAAQQSEYLADAYAAVVCGWQETINALLTIGQRTDTMLALLRALEGSPQLEEESVDEERLIRILKRFPGTALEPQEACQAALRLYIEERLADLKERLCVPLEEQEIVRLAAQADQALQARTQKEAQNPSDQNSSDQNSSDQSQSERSPDDQNDHQHEDAGGDDQSEQQLIDWRHYDWDLSGDLDIQETRALVAELRAHPDKMLFRLSLTPDAQWETHPTIRNRVLYLYNAFERS